MLRHSFTLSSATEMLSSCSRFLDEIFPVAFYSVFSKADVLIGWEGDVAIN